MLVKRDMVGLVKLVKGVYLLKLSCMEATELVGLLAFLRTKQPRTGSLWGILEYLSQSNDNTDFVDNKEKFKFIDDLSILEIINLISIGIASYQFKMHVASDIPTNGYIIPNKINTSLPCITNF